MRIEAYNQVAQLYQTQNVKKAYGASSAAAARDQVTISQAGRDFQIAKKAVAEAADIREDLVADVKTRIQNGTYSVEAGDFAAKLMEKYNAL